jgi:hypothetical protein
MKKPIYGDQLSILYKGAVVTAMCNEITETPKGGPGAARFTILSKTLFKNGTEAHLIDGTKEMPITVERVTEMRHKNVNIISFRGIFDTAATARATA